jgi:hypothetical protein
MSFREFWNFKWEKKKKKKIIRVKSLDIADILGKIKKYLAI